MIFDPKIKDDPTAQNYVRNWIEALRSGEYEQGVKRLRFRDDFCCLGVACDLIDPTRWSPSDRWQGEHILLPESVMHKLCIATSDGSYDMGGESYDSLDNRNDAGDSFERIAQIIEEQLVAALIA